MKEYFVYMSYTAMVGGQAVSGCVSEVMAYPEHTPVSLIFTRMSERAALQARCLPDQKVTPLGFGIMPARIS